MLPRQHACHNNHRRHVNPGILLSPTPRRIRLYTQPRRRTIPPLRHPPLKIYNHRLHPLSATADELTHVNYVALEFTTQKNGVRGELVGLGKSGHPVHCPVQAILCRIQHFQAHHAPMITPLYSYYDLRWQKIDTNILTWHLRN